MEDYLDRIGFVLGKIWHHASCDTRDLTRASLGLNTVGYRRMLLWSVDGDACHIELAEMHGACDTGERTAI